MVSNKGYILIVLCSFALLVSTQEAYCTYHLYSENEPLTDVSCSDGANGLITRWGYHNLSPLFPYVAAWSQASWNSPKCGYCLNLTDVATKKHVYITSIDQCGPAFTGFADDDKISPNSGYDSHFDISQPAFTELFGPNGINAGHGIATYQQVKSTFCKGNKG